MSARVSWPSPSVSSRRDTSAVVHTWFEDGFVVPPSQFHTSCGSKFCAVGHGGRSLFTPMPRTSADSGEPSHEFAPSCSVDDALPGAVGEKRTRTTPELPGGIDWL